MTNEWNPNDPDAVVVHYDLSAWTFDQQAELASDLADAEIQHAWGDGPELLVPEDFESAADSAIAIVEERLGINDEQPVEGSAPEPIELAEDTLTTEYDLAEWQDDERALVGDLLVHRHLPFRWNEHHVLLVATEHEAQVEEILDSVEKGEAEPPPTPSDAAARPATLDVTPKRLPFETLTTFFLAGERLKRNPLDADGLEQLLKALDVAEPESPPYGVEKPLWERTCELADELADALVDDDEPDEAQAVVVATELHELLRPYV